MAVRAYHGEAGQGDAQFRGHHVHDALARVAQVEQGNAGLLCRCPGGLDKSPTARHQGFIAAAWKGIDDVIHGAEHPFRGAHLAAFGEHVLQGNGAGALVQEYAVDGQQAFAAAQALHLVQLP